MVNSLGGGFGALGLAGLLGDTAQADAGRAAHFQPRAKRIIHLFMNGGPFQGDLFDPKPLTAKYAGQRPDAVNLRTERPTAGLLPSPYKFTNSGESGVPVSELLPRFAQVIDDVCVLRSVYTDNPNHGPALLLMNNGTIIPTRPSMGSWLSYGLGTENQDLPGYVVLCPGRPVRFSILWTSAFLPGEHQGTYINHSQIAPDKLIPYLHSDQSASDLQVRQLELMRRLDRAHQEQRGGDPQLEARIRAMETAFRMQSSATEAFDISAEPESVREAYGNTHFSNGCLLARRLAERDVRFIQVYYGNGQPWDTHNDHSKQVVPLCEDVDRAMSALLVDLKQRGLLDDTLVVWGGEFGRTPTSENGDGRDHNHYGFSMWMAGGGVKGGMTYGETDDFGFRAVQDRVHIHDLHATILHLMGLDHERLTYRYAGRDFRLTDVEGRVIKEILA
ncbi:MAG: DUF1501 domain-containing protein [Planctomycetota bacterium]|nr:MAG: DUF1501 domain-containing protein [Planctomycetota bacterium]REK26175.1 MAG: DUF1501 domain-containing protein [Planctomycetota bacterium]REK33541.1 MAG: DUF1501 domain-containing protein [Planctomycetota bacterium]